MEPQLRAGGQTLPRPWRIKESTCHERSNGTDSEEIGIQLQEKFPELDPYTVRFTDLHRYVTELPGFIGDPAKSNEGILEAIQTAGTKSTRTRSSPRQKLSAVMLTREARKDNVSGLM